MIDVEQGPPEVKALAEAMGALSAQLFDAGWHTGCERTAPGGAAQIGRCSPISPERG
jgi:hypothetical protein